MPKPLVALGVALVPVALTAAALATATTAADGAVATYKLTYASLPDGTKQVVRWNGCQTGITYKVNLGAVPSAKRSAVLSDTQRALVEVQNSTGFRFVYKGSTTEVPRVGSMPKQSAELVIAYTSPSKTNYSLTGSTLGQGGLYYGWVSRTVNGKTTYTVAAQRGFVVIDTPQMLTQLGSGTGTGLRRTNLLTHELGHAMGLQHVSDTRQQMYPVLRTTSPKLYYSGDRYGLTKVGKSAGCVNTTYMPVRDL
ncbi:Matrixin [Pedococcus dokdonensis]|uniref:Matrixin n=1 Tax=Pedococcus dokdonensis TaxID=443156 RepID=A0A1H0SFD9_9MICO|nr:matrixin family metalloprotease [Pedococcus dokdonensis]SDP40407.1 Matrixin [Pedococcus dokdonensis]